MDILLAADTKLFFAINHLPHTAASDAIAQFFSLIGSFGLVWLGIGGIFFLKEERKHHAFFLPLIGTIGVSYILVEMMLKPFLGRLRPYSALSGVIASVRPTADAFSFPSGHATIAFAMAVVVSRYEPRLRWVWYGLAAVISFTRVYLGVHYPSDVVAGVLLGWGIGSVMLRAFRHQRVFRR